MKICTRCNIPKTLEHFRNMGNGKHDYCTKCFYIYQKQRWNRNKLILINELGGKCFDCKKEFHPACFDFHHRDPSKKDFAIGEFRSRSLNNLRTEIKKCDLLCVCCHRLRHLSDECWEFDWQNPEPEIRISKPKNICFCGKTTKTHKETYCSPECAAKSRQIVDWPENLSELVANSSKRAVAMSLGVSDKAVSKRLKNHHSKLT